MASKPRIALLKSRRLAFQLDEALDGGTIHVVKQLQTLSRNGYAVDAFTRSEAPGDSTPIEILPGIRLWHVPFERGATDDLFMRDLREGRSFVQGVLACPGFAAACFDAILVHHWTSGVEIEQSIPDAMPLLFTPHLLPSEKSASSGLALPAAAAAVEHSLLTRADRVIALSQAEERSCRNLGGRHVVRVPNGVSDAFFALPLREDPPPPGGRVRLGSIGRLCTQKGTDILLDALKRLLSQGMDASLEVAGPSYGEDAFEMRLLAQLRDSALAHRVRLLGPVPHEALPALVSTWDVYVQPSRYESQGIALLEAMASGCRIVATALPAVTEFLDGTMAQLVAAPPTGETVAEAIRRALVEPAWRDRAERSRQAASAFRWNETSANLLSNLDAAIDASPWQKPPGPDHNRGILECAHSNARRIVEDDPTAKILLLGSSARGTAKPGSDIDLLVFSDGLQPPSSDWHYSEGIAVDVRWESADEIHGMCEMSDKEFADAVANHPIVDHLWQARALTSVGAVLTDVIAQLLRRRLSAPVRDLVADEMLARATAAFEKAAIFAHRELPYDAQLEVNAGAQLLLQAELVRLGWIVQGAKRRPEAAVAYSRHSEHARRAVSFLTEAIGIDGVTRAAAARVIAARMQMRSEHLACLEKLDVAPIDIATARRHSEGVTDYYAPAIADGYLKGCINHVRALSGVPLMPGAYAKLLDLDASAPVSSFLACRDISENVKALWLDVMEPRDSRGLSELATRGIGLVRNCAHR